MIDRKKLYSFLGLTFFINYLIGALYIYLKYQTDVLTTQKSIAMAIIIFYMLVPALVSIFLIFKVFHEKMSDYGFNFHFNKNWLAVWILPFMIAGLTILISYLLGWGRLDLTFESFIKDLESTIPPEEIEKAREQISSLSDGWQYLIMLGQALFFGTTINALAAFGEEMGWRGFLYKTLRPLGFWRANLLIGAIWGIWHAPIILTGYNFPAHPVLGVFVMTAACTLLALLFGYIREASGSVIAVAILHGVFNATAGVSIMIIADADNIYRSPLGFAGIIAMALLVGALYPVYKSKISDKRTSGES